MECDDKKGYIYCAHCNDFVSRSTFERHERKRNKSNLTDTFGSTPNSRDLFQEISSKGSIVLEIVSIFTQRKVLIAFKSLW